MTRPAEGVDTELLEAFDEAWARRLGQGKLFPADRIEEQSAVLDHHEVEQVEAGHDPLQIRQLPSRHQNQPARTRA